jgi:fructosamine-3-kinase
MIVLVAIGLVFGGVVHSAVHVDDHGDCHFCHITPVLIVGGVSVVAAAAPALERAHTIQVAHVVSELWTHVGPRPPPI